MKVFAMTFAYNEAFFLPRWVTYYGSQLGRENLFIIDHGSTDLSMQGLGNVNILRVPRESYDEVQRVLAASALHAGLLHYYDAGFISDCDEFLVADPRNYTNLRDFASKAPGTALACVGLELFHDRLHEPEFNPALSILAQRNLVLFDSWMCKRSYASKPTRFGGGFHTSDQPVNFAEDLYLIHVKNFDYRLRVARQRVTSAWSYKGDWGEHARRELEYVEQVFDGIDKRIAAGLVTEDFDFTAEISRCVQRTALNPSSEYDFNINGGFNGTALRRLPSRFLNLF
jgi:hypothetical protein